MIEVAAKETRVLVADDAATTRERLCTMLSEMTDVRAFGCAADRSVLLDRAAALRPACIVIDIPIHDGAGYELVGALRAQDQERVIVVLSNHATEEFRQRSVDAGADHFLTKSTEFEHIMDIVRPLGETP